MVFYRFEGEVDNSEVHSYYRENTVDCFIHVSDSEGGCPISIAEAISYGIPVIGKNVGGVGELIDRNGVLLPRDASVEDVGNAIVKLISEQSFEDTNEFRRKSRELWEKKYNATSNAKNFAKYIEKLQVGGVETIIWVIESLESDWGFIEDEFKTLSSLFQIIFIETNIKKDSILRKSLKEEYPKVLFLEYKYCMSFWEKLFYCLKYCLDNKITDEKKSIVLGKNKIINRLIDSVEYYARACKFEKWLEDKKVYYQIKECSSVYYTYWHTAYTLALVLPWADHYDMKKITREHGYDLYDERNEKTQRQPFREYMDVYLDNIIFACEAGKEYYCKRNKVSVDSPKYKVFRLGSRYVPVEFATIAPHERNKNFSIVSCSNMIPLKRVDLIIDAIAYASKKIDRDINWVHFGDGSQKIKMEVYARNRFGESGCLKI